MKIVNVSLDIALAIIRVDDLLLFQRRNKEPYRNLLGLLGGKKEEGEDIITVLKREIFEESGLDVVYSRPLGIVYENYHENDKIFNFNLHIFYVNCSGIIKHNKDEGEVIWISIEEFKSLKEEFIPSDWLIVNSFLNNSFKEFELNVFKSDKTYSIKIKS